MMNDLATQMALANALRQQQQPQMMDTSMPPTPESLGGAPAAIPQMDTSMPPMQTAGLGSKLLGAGLGASGIYGLSKILRKKKPEPPQQVASPPAPHAPGLGRMEEQLEREGK